MELYKTVKTTAPFISSEEWCVQKISQQIREDELGFSAVECFYCWSMLRYPWKEGDVGGYPIPQYRKKYWQIPKYCVKNRPNTDTTVMIGHVYLKLCSITRVCLPQPCMHQNNLRHCEKTWEDLGRDAFNQNFRKVRSKTQWIGLVQPEKFRKNWSTFWGRPLFPVGPVEILVEWIAPLDRYYDRKQGHPTRI